MPSFRASLQLCRFPAVFTALADIALGFFLVRSTLGDVPELCGLLVASAGLYLGGMVLNDVFDRHVDAIERPTRPIPSGRVSLRSAALLGTVLLAGGLAAATLTDRNSALVAALLAACILAYDGGLKRTPLGPLVMGGCRFLNVILGASSAGVRWTSPWLPPHVWIAAALGVYIVGVTIVARGEAARSRRGMLLAGALVANIGITGVLLLIWDPWAGLVGWNGAPSAALKAFIVLGLIAVSIDRRVAVAITNPEPAFVQAAVKVMLLSIIMLDSTIIYAKLGDAGVVYAIATALLVVPAVTLGRWIYVT